MDAADKSLETNIKGREGGGGGVIWKCNCYIRALAVKCQSLIVAQGSL